MYSEPSQTSKMKRFVKILADSKPLISFAKRVIVDAWHGSEYTSGLSRDFPTLYFGFSLECKDSAL